MPKGTMLYTSVHGRKDLTGPFFHVTREKIQHENRHMLVLYDGAVLYHLFFNRMDFRRRGYAGVKIRFCNARLITRTRGWNARAQGWQWSGCCAEAWFQPDRKMLVWSTWWDDGKSESHNVRTLVEDPKKVWDLLEKLGPMAHPSSRRHPCEYQ